MTWYRFEDKTFLYEGDLQLLGLSDSTTLPDGIVKITITPQPISENPLVGFVMGDPTEVDGVWQTTWAEVTFTQEEYDAMVEKQKEFEEFNLKFLRREI